MKNKPKPDRADKKQQQQAEREYNRKYQKKYYAQNFKSYRQQQNQRV